MSLREELERVYFGSPEGCSDRECDGCKADFERVLAFVQEKLGADA